VALLILVIACSTYINLSTARSVDRAREVGVRKVIGAGRRQLFWQFIGESFLLCLIAVVLSLGVVLLALPAFNRLADRQLPASGLFSLPFLGIALLTAVIVSLLAGSYPALVLSRFHPVKVLKGAFRNTRGGQGLRQSLIVFQFVISVFLIVSTFVMGEQLRFIRDKKLGYDRDHVLELPMNRSLLAKLDYMKAELRRNPNVVSVSTCASSPMEIFGGYNMRNDRMPAGEQLNVFADPVDEDFIATTGLEIVAGEGITRQDMRDAHPEEGPQPDTTAKPVYHFVLNETAARELGWSPQEAIGKRMWLDESRPGLVKGVVKDFNFQSLHIPIKGLVLFPEHRTSRLLVRVAGHASQNGSGKGGVEAGPAKVDMAETLDYLAATWKRLAPGIPYSVRFLDENYRRLYASEQRLGTVMNLFSGIAIVLACLGLLGLSSYAAKQRVKEIGIRKVLGASTGRLTFLLSAGFVRLAVVAMFVAFPLAWWAMGQWLQDFVYRISISVWVFVLSGVLVLAVTLATVSIQAVKTALLNPAVSMRSE
jgi:putative ABC transport system permease protein